jgi:hypothetical protein
MAIYQSLYLFNGVSIPFRLLDISGSTKNIDLRPDWNDGEDGGNHPKITFFQASEL